MNSCYGRNSSIWEMTLLRMADGGHFELWMTSINTDE